MTTIHVHGGLANRLRAIISWRHTVGPITVAWKPDGQVAHERFSDAFRPIAGVEFIDRVPEGAHSTYEPHPHAREGWERGYLDLQPLAEPPAFNHPYAAVHMRRTDAIEYQKQCMVYEADWVFVQWIRDTPADLIFLATDNGTTQYEMVQAIYNNGKQPRFHRYITEHPDQDKPEVRNTPLLHAVWDIWSCVGADYFRGSGASSYTNLIATLRRLRAEGT